VQVPPRSTVDSSFGFGWLRTMPAILNGSKVMGFKAMHSTPGVGVGYFVDLYDLPSGELLATMDADWLTAQRTAAVAAIGGWGRHACPTA
jgi:ornithine cyclodeaminase/alanine dehydrogenase-like protein (mu-crystallin family)